jgi:tetratricopeptide (TPR) repeat protein
VSAEVRAPALLAAGHLAYFQGDNDQAQPLLELADELFRGLDDRRGRARSLGRLAWLAQDTGDVNRGERLLAVVIDLLPQVTEPRARGDVLRFIGGGLGIRGELVPARAYLEEERAIWEALGNSPKLANCLNNLSWVALKDGDLTRARELLDESIAAARAANDRFSFALALGGRGVVAVLEGDMSAAALVAAEHLELCREDGDRRQACESLVVAAAVAARSHPTDATRLVAAAEALGALDEVHRGILERHVAPAAGLLSKEVAAMLQAEGASMSLSDAVTSALQVLEEPRRAKRPGSPHAARGTHSDAQRAPPRPPRGSAPGR